MSIEDRIYRAILRYQIETKRYPKFLYLGRNEDSQLTNLIDEMPFVTLRESDYVKFSKRRFSGLEVVSLAAPSCLMVGEAIEEE